MPKYEGGCLCGAVRYICEGDPVEQGACHCRDCQFVSGGGPAHSVVLPTDLVQITQGAPETFAKLSENGARVSRYFCGGCGTQLFARNAEHPERTSVAVGSLDNPALYAPHGHLCVDAAPRWHRLEADLSRLLREAA